MKYFDNILRYSKFVNKSSSFYFYTLIFCVLFFVVFGIIPLGISIFEKIKVINEINTTLTALDTKEKSLIKAKQELEDVKRYLLYLDIYMPVEMNVDDYLVALDSAISAKGFFLRRVSTDNKIDNNALSISLNLDGYGDLKELVKGIEELQRSTSISSVDINTIKNRQSINLVLQIFSR